MASKGWIRADCFPALRLVEEQEDQGHNVVYIVPITSILGRLPLIPAGDHGTIPVALRGSKSIRWENATRTGRQALAASSSIMNLYQLVGHVLAH